MKRRNLKPDPAAAIKALAQQASTAGHDKDTVPTGIMDLGEAGDLQASETNEAGETTTTSFRGLAGDLATAQERIDDAETIIQGAQADIDQAKTDAAAAQARLDAPDAALAGSIAAAMTTETKKLIVTEQAILQHATLLGTTVVEQINVSGKLVGTNGVFTGTVDFANVNVTGTQIVNKLGANSIDASKINGDSFTGKTFQGLTMTGGTMKTSESPFTDGGVQIDASYGIRGWAPGSAWQNTSFQLSASDGTLSMAANAYFTNPSSKNGLVIAPQTASGNAALFFGVNRSVGADSAAIWRQSYTTAREPLNLRGANGAGVTVQGGLTVTSGVVEINGGRFGGLDSNSDNFNAQALRDFTVQGTLYGNSNMTVSGSFIYFSSLPTSGASTSVVINPDTGRIARSSSSRRYKKYIKDWKPDPSTVLALQPRTWVPKVGSDEGIECTADGSYVGFIAEEVHDLGLTELVAYSEGPDGQQRPESLNYDRFAAAQQIVLRDHDTRIQQLEERLAALEEGPTHGTA